MGGFAAAWCWPSRPHGAGGGTHGARRADAGGAVRHPPAALAWSTLTTPLSTAMPSSAELPRDLPECCDDWKDEHGSPHAERELRRDWDGGILASPGPGDVVVVHRYPRWRPLGEACRGTTTTRRSRGCRGRRYYDLRSGGGLPSCCRWPKVKRPVRAPGPHAERMGPDCPHQFPGKATGPGRLPRANELRPHCTLLQTYDKR